MYQTEILKPSPANLHRAAAHLCAGELVGLPTETVYGLAGNALDEVALQRIFSAKARPHFDPLIVHIAERYRALDLLISSPWVDLGQYPAPILSALEVMIQNFWPGPLTLVLPRTAQIPDLVTSGLDTVALRMPAHPVAQALLNQLEFPLAAPSANRFGQISPTSAQAVWDELNTRLPIILEGGTCRLGLESTVVLVGKESLEILRPGMITAEMLKQLIDIPIRHISSHPAELRAPGMLKKHYAPRKPLYLLAPEIPLAEVAAWVKQNPQVGWLLWEEAEYQALGKPMYHFLLSTAGDFEIVAPRFFQGLRTLDASAASYLLVRKPSESKIQAGLGYAIYDRLSKAATGHFESLAALDLQGC